MSTLKPLLLSLVLLFGAAAQAAPSDELIRPIQDRWAEIKYRSPAKQQADLYNELSEKVRQISTANRNFPRQSLAAINNHFFHFFLIPHCN